MQGSVKHQTPGEQQPEDPTTEHYRKHLQNKSRKNTRTIKRQKQAKIIRTLEQEDRDVRQHLSAQIYTPGNYPHTSAHAQTNIRYR